MLKERYNTVTMGLHKYIPTDEINFGIEWYSMLSEAIKGAPHICDIVLKLPSPTP